MLQKLRRRNHSNNTVTRLTRDLNSESSTTDRKGSVSRTHTCSNHPVFKPTWLRVWTDRRTDFEPLKQSGFKIFMTWVFLISICVGEIHSRRNNLVNSLTYSLCVILLTSVLFYITVEQFHQGRSIVPSYSV